MKSHFLLLLNLPANSKRSLILTLCSFSFAVALLAGDDPIDWNRARGLHQRDQRGEKLSSEDQTYLDRARKLRAAGQGPGNAGAEKPAAVQPAAHFTPLTELGAGHYQSEDGGLYGGGNNEPPAGHREAANKQAALIRPLDSEGKPSPSGKVVLLSIGMSNTTQEFSVFKRTADADSGKAPSLLIVDGAQGGQEATRTSTDAAPFWDNIEQRLRAAGATPAQVQVIWLKQAIAGPKDGFPAETRRLQSLLGKIVAITKLRYPNLRIAYLSSRIYAGYATTRLNPEPYAYESAFAVRGLILDQIRGSAELNWDSSHGPVRSPLLLWGPYLWGDGAKPRQVDGLVWLPEDFAADGTHPSASGRRKVAEQLLKFFKTDTTARPWFLAP